MCYLTEGVHNRRGQLRFLKDLSATMFEFVFAKYKCSFFCQSISLAGFHPRFLTFLGENLKGVTLEKFSSTDHKRDSE